MPISAWFRLVFILLPALWGAANLRGALRTREAPQMRLARLLLGACGLLLAIGTGVQVSRYLGIQVLGIGSWVLGVGVGVTGLVMIYRQSLHNTTM